ncbi:uncharacterized protein BX664DRAFT_319514 [Halteromyces radiatus]|uniref:uncharacterized protein n=1 Tax=Halteromyces radiatus TaxID=101107 RepID=UPI00221F1D53|nr:uncharacterized protein BX664DRAFT_319514 [Halteromyces radiatus]KAI8098753.1 hypothetical protein BX664DRAFT_319514 [Halteromyces radiatus]
MVISKSGKRSRILYLKCHKYKFSYLYATLFILKVFFLFKISLNHYHHLGHHPRGIDNCIIMISCLITITIIVMHQILLVQVSTAVTSIMW